MMTIADSQKVREEIEGLSANKTSRRYPPALRERVVRWARQRLAAGAVVDDVCRELDIGSPTLRRFLGRHGAGRRKSRRGVVFEQLRVREAAPPAPPSECRLLVRGPRGLVVEGLSLADVAQLLERLSCSA